MCSKKPRTSERVITAYTKAIEDTNIYCHASDYALTRLVCFCFTREPLVIKILADQETEGRGFDSPSEANINFVCEAVFSFLQVTISYIYVYVNFC